MSGVQIQAWKSKSYGLMPRGAWRVSQDTVLGSGAGSQMPTPLLDMTWASGKQGSGNVAPCLKPEVSKCCLFYQKRIRKLPPTFQGHPEEATHLSESCVQKSNTQACSLRSTGSEFTMHSPLRGVRDVNYLGKQQKQLQKL